MRSPLVRLASGLIVISGLAVLWVIPSYARSPQVPGTVGQPGVVPTRVWINNQKREDAVPVTIVYADPKDVAMPVKIQGVSPVQIQGVATVAVNGPVATTQSKQPWEYRVLSAGSDQELAAAMNGAGNDGWEAVGVTSQPGGKVTAVLKRPR